MLRYRFASTSTSFLFSVKEMSSYSQNQRKLEGKIAVVTASTDGIGLAIANRLVRDGAKVMVSSRKQKNVEKAVALLQKEYGDDCILGTVCHVGEDLDRKRLIQETVDAFGGIDILVSNAAVNPTFGPTLQTPDSAWDKIFSINVKAAALLVKEAFPHLQKSKNGSVVFVSSVGGYLPFSMLGPYSISKTALFGLTKVLSQELATDHIRVNCLAPGLIKTKFSSAIWKNEDAAGEFLKNIPLSRLGEPDDCSGIVSFLSSDEAMYITGETVSVNGGISCRL